MAMKCVKKSHINNCKISILSHLIYTFLAVFKYTQTFSNNVQITIDKPIFNIKSDNMPFHCSFRFDKLLFLLKLFLESV
ncbi:hypothetical protein M153_6040002430 [Pseudoloma neurophilia]|uniref:Uncharacterized protein n=1 Tax=Pseudoloma neurophilia TaxID=146866 RepID=A0A0R0LWX0_9MICR|nr:hypothetical protein M153_6040002430 [Pseudoloma neurophilia]